MTTVSQDDAFGMEFLERIVDWIPSKLSPEEVFSEYRLIKWAISRGVGEVFTRAQVDKYLDDHGLVAVEKGNQHGQNDDV